MTTLAQAAAQFGFNPSEKRGFGGKWIKVGEMVKSAEHGSGQVTAKHPDGSVSIRVEDPDSDTGSVVKKVAASTLSPRAKTPKLSDAQKKARTKRLDDLDRT